MISYSYPQVTDHDLDQLSLDNLYFTNPMYRLKEVGSLSGVHK